MAAHFAASDTLLFGHKEFRIQFSAMTLTGSHSPPLHSGSKHRDGLQRNKKTHAVRMERRDVSQTAYKRRASAKSRRHNSAQGVETPEFSWYTLMNGSRRAMYEGPGRQVSTTECASRSAPIQSVDAATKAQHEYHAHHALVERTIVERRVERVCTPSLNSRPALPSLRTRPAEFGSLGTPFESAPNVSDNSTILGKIACVMDMLRRAFDRTQLISGEKGLQTFWLCGPGSGDSGVRGTDFDDITYGAWHLKAELHYRDELEVSPRDDDTGQRWSACISSDSESSSDGEDGYEFDIGTPEEVDDAALEARRAAMNSLCSGSRWHREWIAQVLMAPPLSKSGRRPSVSKVPSLLTILEDSELRV